MFDGILKWKNEKNMMKADEKLNEVKMGV